MSTFITPIKYNTTPTNLASFPRPSKSIATNSLYKNTVTPNSLAVAFSTAAKISAEENLINGTTWNGDVNYSSLGNDFKAALLALDQKMVLPEESRKTRELSDQVIDILDQLVKSFIICANSIANESDRAKAFNLMFRYLFYLRSVRVAGKKSKLLFYYLYKRLYFIFPKTCIALLDLVPDFGYFGDLDALIHEMESYPDVVNAALNVYIKYLNSDCLLIFGKPIAQITKDDAVEVNTMLKSMSVEEIREFVGTNHISLAAKWAKREGKQNSSHRTTLLANIYYPNGGILDLQASKDPNIKKCVTSRTNYCNMVFRNVITTLSQCILVGEQMMCETNNEFRTWSDIQHNCAPATFITKYRKALGNEDLKIPVTDNMHDTGNRHPENEDRVQCRKNLLHTLMEGKLKGAAQDIDRLGTIIYNHVEHGHISQTLSTVERQMISAQWNDIISSLTKDINIEIEALKASAIESGEQFIDPRHIVPVCDTSGSMSSEKVQDKAITMAILAANLSTLPGVLIAFSERPSVYSLDMSQNTDVFDHFLTIINGPTGLSTNIDATFDCMLDIMQRAKLQATDFAMLFLTDGQFNSGVVMSYSKLNNTAFGRMKAKFTNHGYNLPRIIFWNFNCTSPGFSTSATTKGAQLVSGYSQSLMMQVFTGDYKYVLQEDGTTKIDVDPWTSFEKALLNEGYDPVTHVVANIGEGYLYHLSINE